MAHLHPRSLSEEQLAFKMKMNRLDVRKATGPLRLDKFVKMYVINVVAGSFMSN